MTDPGYPLDDITVTGQRRRPDGTYPSRGGSGGGGANEPGGTNQWELEEEDETPPEGQVDPCADPVSRKIWNADAAAAAGAAALIAKAASLNDGSSLANREFGSYLLLGANGQVNLQPNITVGDPAVLGSVPNVSIDVAGVHSGNWMGDIHNHPSGDGNLSGGEWAEFINMSSQYSATNPERAELSHVSVYVVVLDASSPTGYRIYAYNKDTPYNQLGAEVNPDAQPCPAT
ncbi:hypothetical protein [Brevundimonas sp.]|uniref:hypothetical protein n=1 Tax=Brevundimonas sp. TaxID=1871086 RepID=UPI00356B5702